MPDYGPLGRSRLFRATPRQGPDRPAPRYKARPRSQPAGGSGARPIRPSERYGSQPQRLPQFFNQAGSRASDRQLAPCCMTSWRTRVRVPASPVPGPAARQSDPGQAGGPVINSSVAHPSRFRGPRGEVVQVPERLDGADVAGILPGLGWCTEKLRGPKVADRLPVAVEHVQHRPLMAFRGLSEVVAVIGGAGRGQQAQSAPAALAGEGGECAAAAPSRRPRG